MSLAILFPGQGSQYPGLLHNLPESPSVSAVLGESRRHLVHLGIDHTIDDAVALNDTMNAQLVLLIAGVSCARALVDDHGLSAHIVMGHSIGSFAAAVIAGVLTLPEAIAAVQLRGQAMGQACAGGSWGMAAITGLAPGEVRQLVDAAGSSSDPVWLANINSATQCVLAGTVSALEAARRHAQQMGATAFDILATHVASHCPLQQSTAAALAQYFSAIPRRPLTADYLTNMRGRRVNNPDAVLDDLAQSVAHPVRWYDGARLLPELGVTCAVQMPPGHVQAALVSASAPAVVTLAMADLGLPATVARARRYSS